MNKKEREAMEKKIKSVEETIAILKHQESNLLEAMCHHSYDHNEAAIKKWVHEIFIGCDYIVRLENSIKIMKQILNEGKKGDGKNR